MANEVKQEVNVQAEVSGQQQINDLIKAFDELQKEINNINNLDINNLSSGIDNAKEHIKEFTNTLINLNDKGIVNDDQFMAVGAKIQNLKSQLQGIITLHENSASSANKYNEILDKISNGGAIKLLSNNFADANKQLETSEQWLARITKLVDELPDKNKELIDTKAIEEAKEQVEEIKEQLNTIVKPDFEKGFFESDDYAAWLEKDIELSEEVNEQTVDLSAVFGQLAKQAGLTNSSMDGLLKTLGASAGEIATVAAAVAPVILLFKELSKSYDEVTNFAKDAALNIGKFVENLGIGSVDLFIDSLNLICDAFSELTNIADEAIDQLQDFADIGSEIQSSYFRIYQYLGESAGQDIINYTDNISTLFNLDGTALLKNMKGILAVTSQLGLDTDGVVKYSKALQQLSLDLSAFSGETVESIGQQFENAINLGVLNSRSAIAKAFDLTDADIKQFKELNTELERTNFLLSKGAGIQGTYAAYMDTAAGKVMQLKNAYSNLMNTVGKLALALYATVAPVLIKIINLINWALTGLAKFLKIDLSSPVSNNAIGQVGKYADNIGKIGDNIEEAGKQAEKASKKVASFDDVIQISEDKKSSGSGASSGFGDVLDDIGSMDPASILGGLGDAAEDDIFSIDKLKAKIQELIDDFKAWEEAINWDEWRHKAANFGKVLAELANIIVDDEQAWKDLGDLIGNSINVALEFLNAFAKEFHFEQLGKDIAVALKEIFNDLDEDLAAETIYNWLVGVLSTGIGFFKERPLTSAADSISTIIAEFFNKLTTRNLLFNDDGQLEEVFGIERITTFIDEAISDILGAINTSLDNFDNNNTSDKFALVISSIFTKLGERTPEIIETVSRYLQFLLNTLGTTISQSIDGFFTGLESNDDGADKIINSLIGLIDSIFNNIGLIAEALDSHKETVIELINGFIQGLADNEEGWASSIKSLIDVIFTILMGDENTEGIDFTSLGNTITKFLEDSGISKTVGDWVALKLQWLWETQIKPKLTTILSAAAEFLQSEQVKSALNSVILSIGEWLLTTLLDQFDNINISIRTTIEDAIYNLFNFVKTLFEVPVQSAVALLMSALGFDEDEIQKILDSIDQAFDGAWDFISSLLQTIMAAGNAFTLDIRDIVNIIQGDVDGLKEPFVHLWEKIKEVFGNIKDYISGVWNTISGIFTSISNKIKDITGKKTELQSIQNINYQSSTFRPISVPKLAIGGIVNNPTHAVIGEDGQEAVLPLQKNTEWMDALASRLASQINNGAGNNGGTVNIKLSSKNFYTRAEMLDFAEQVVAALRVYGVNVSVAY